MIGDLLFAESKNGILDTGLLGAAVTTEFPVFTRGRLFVKSIVGTLVAAFDRAVAIFRGSCVTKFIT